MFGLLLGWGEGVWFIDLVIGLNLVLIVWLFGVGFGIVLLWVMFDLVVDLGWIVGVCCLSLFIDLVAVWW